MGKRRPWHTSTSTRVNPNIPGDAYRDQAETIDERLARITAERDDLEHKFDKVVRSVFVQRDGIICSVPGCDAFVDQKIDPAYNLCLLHYHNAVTKYVRYHRSHPLPPHTAPEVQQDVRATREPSDAVVYYIARAGDRTKIGWTTNLPRRMSQLYAQPDDLLAIEPGDRSREIERHQQFAHDRITGTELFTNSDRLIEHISQAREMFGDPSRFLD